MSPRDPGQYLELRMGVGRQCWDGCDRTPCRYPRAVRRMRRRAERHRVRLQLALVMIPVGNVTRPIQRFRPGFDESEIP